MLSLKNCKTQSDVYQAIHNEELKRAEQTLSQFETFGLLRFENNSEVLFAVLETLKITCPSVDVEEVLYAKIEAIKDIIRFNHELDIAIREEA